MADRAHAVIALHGEGVSVVLDVTDGRLPAILHWGADLGELTPDDAEALRTNAQEPGAANSVTDVRLSLLPEHWTGWLGRPGLSGSRAGRDWSPKFQATSVTLDGVEVAAAGDRPALANAGPASVQVQAVDPVAQLACAITIELTTGGLIRAQAEVTNASPEPYALQDCVLAFAVPADAREILDMAGRWGKERVPQRRPLTVGIHLREGRKGRTGADAATLLHLGVPGFGFATGEIWAVHVGWSGNHTHYAERVSNGEQVIGGGELLLPGEVILAEGEAYRTPWVYGSYGDGLDEVARRFHRFLRARPSHPGPNRPVTLNVWEAVYFDHSVDRLIELAERAAEIGVERYVLDDGWFGGRRHDRAGLGDWTVSPDVWPAGLHPLVDKVTELGMEFGLWFEPEMINQDSDIARRHPEWMMATGDRLPIEQRHQQVINLGISECYNYIRDAILALLDEYAIGYIKWDHNRDLIDAGSQPSGRPGVHAQTLALYRLIDELKAAHPGLEIESCSSGGGRVDLGILQRTDRVWVSDCIDPLDRQQMLRWTTQLVPPELMGSHIASAHSHTTGRSHDLSFRAGTAVFGHLGIEWDIAKVGSPELAELAAWIEFYKEHRELLLGGDLVRLDFPDRTVNVGGVVAPDRSRAIYSLASLDGSDVVLVGRIRLPGLAPDRRYRVTPLLVGRLPYGVRPPPWWGIRLPKIDYYDSAGSRPAGLSADAIPQPAGVVLSGAALGTVGLTAPNLNPEQVALYLAQAVD
jgi:alpha-galactosidase